MLKQRRSFPHVVAALALVLVFGVAMRELLAGKAFPIWDAERLFSPAYMLIADFARQGSLLWWSIGRTSLVFSVRHHSTDVRPN